MKKKLLFIFALLSLIIFTGCNVTEKPDDGNKPDINHEEPGPQEDPINNHTDEKDENEYDIDDKHYESDVDIKDEEEIEEIIEEIDNTNYKIKCDEGTAGAFTVDGSTITFSGITEKSVYVISGEFNGNIIIDVTEDYKFELDFNGFTLASTEECPLQILSGDKVTLSAKKETENYIYDNRAEVTDENGISSAVYAKCDLSIQGKGALTVVSLNNNGIHTKDDLEVKNLTLSVKCKDNALKGNDSVTITSGNLTLIASQGDGIKTDNSDVSTKGNQRGIVAINGGKINIYAACDGIDASYDCVIEELDEQTITLNIYTDKYSSYSEEVTSVTEATYYIRNTNQNYNYSVLYYNSDTDYKWVNASYYKTVTSQGGRDPRGGSSSTYYYYKTEKLTGYRNMKVYVYSKTQTQGQKDSYTYCSSEMSINNYYDTIALSSKNGSVSFGWTNYQTQSQYGPGGYGGPTGGGANEGNRDKSDLSTKGIKADNAITITSGTITIKSYDDSIHVNTDVALENGNSPLGNVIINGGTLSLYSNDDGIHADKVLTINGGNIEVLYSYEALEGTQVYINGGYIVLTSTDDGINATNTSGEGIVITDGFVYLVAGGDGIDSNSQTSGKGIVFNGGTTIVVQTSGGNSALDTERGYTYNGGKVVAIGEYRGMTDETTNCSNFSTKGTKANVTLSKGSLLVVKVNGTEEIVVKMPVAMSSFVVFLSSNSASITSASTTTVELNDIGVYVK